MGPSRIDSNQNEIWPRVSAVKKALAISLLLAAVVVSAAAQTPQYFPSLTFTDDQQQNERVAQGYSGVLLKLREPSLLEESKRDPNARLYRFLWSRALAVQSPIAIRLSINGDGTSVLTIKVVTRRADGSMLKFKETTRTLPKRKTECFIAQLSKLSLWDLPTRDPRRVGLDGSDWLIESVENGRYKVLNRWSPQRGPVHEMGRMLGDLAGIDVRH